MRGNMLSLNVVVFLPHYQKPILHQAKNRFHAGYWGNYLIFYTTCRLSSPARSAGEDSAKRTEGARLMTPDPSVGVRRRTPPRALRREEFYNSLSSVIGRSRTRLPVALNTALAIAAAVPVMPISPMPRAPSGAWGSGMSVHITSIAGTSRCTGR